MLETPQPIPASGFIIPAKLQKEILAVEVILIAIKESYQVKLLPGWYICNVNEVSFADNKKKYYFFYSRDSYSWFYVESYQNPL